MVSLLGAEKAKAYAELAELEADAQAALGDEAARHKAAARAEEIRRALPPG